MTTGKSSDKLGGMRPASAPSDRRCLAGRGQQLGGHLLGCLPGAGRELAGGSPDAGQGRDPGGLLTQQPYIMVASCYWRSNSKLKTKSIIFAVPGDSDFLVEEIATAIICSGSDRRVVNSGSCSLVFSPTNSITLPLRQFDPRFPTPVIPNLLLEKGQRVEISIIFAKGRLRSRCAFGMGLKVQLGLAGSKVYR